MTALNKKAEKTKAVFVRLEPENYNTLLDLAEREDRTIASFLRIRIKEMIKKEANI